MFRENLSSFLVFGIFRVVRVFRGHIQIAAGLAFFQKKDDFLIMADTYTIKTAQQKFSAVVQEAADHPVTITKQGKAVAVMM